MPRWASRLTLIVECVRVERLQDISEDDARAEGLKWISPGYGIEGMPHWDGSPVAAFAALWDSINAKRAPWSSNPFVVALTFSVIKANIDAISEAS